MDKSKVRAIVEANLGPLTNRLGLDRWHITVAYDFRDTDARGQNTWMIDYEKATIELDPGSLKDEAEVMKVLRHELFHLVHAPFSIFFNAIDPVLDQDPTRRAMALSVWTHAKERAVLNLERMYAGLTAPAEAREAS